MGNVTVDFSKELGKIKDMNSVNNGPAKDGCLDNFDAFRAARIPFARLHDSSFYWRHTVDMLEVFPDFDADENDPGSYDFTLTDLYLDDIERAGTKIFYRLGNRIECEAKKYGAVPPKDFDKWARIAEHIVRHENEGWADGFHRGIEYWEIWNEPDTSGQSCWTGTMTEFIRLFDISLKHLKGCFPDLKFGGPALTHMKNVAFFQEFIPYLKTERPPMDFFSFHRYGTTPEALVRDVLKAKDYMIEAGYPDCELILDEWNYLYGWSPRERLIYTFEAIRSLKASAFISACMIACQNSPLDHLMYYDARPSDFNGLFDRQTLETKKGYYSIFAFSDLAELGTQVETIAEGEGIYALAAKSADGKHGALLLTSYKNETSLDGKEYPPENVKIKWDGLSDQPVRVRVRMLDGERDLCEISGETFGSGAGFHTLPLPLYGTVLVTFEELE